MYLTKIILVLLTISIIFAGCSDSEKPEQAEIEQTTKIDVHIQENTIPDYPVKGIIRGSEFEIEQALIENGTLKLRQGKDFFADKSIEIVMFGEQSLENKIIKVDSSSGFSNPHLRLSLKKEGANLPDTKMLMDAYKMELSFGKADDLGIPFAISLIVNGDTNTNIKGHYFATFKDIIVQNGQIDATYDSFDTLEYLTQQYLQTKYQDVEWRKRFGASYVGSGKSNYPKAGFIGYEVSIKDAPDTVVKAQLYKDEKGWRVINLLTENQIHQAHPIAEYIIKNKRSLQSHLAKVAAGLALEKQLNDEGVMARMRTTSANCYTSKELNKASCKMTYGIREGDDIVCMNRNYLVIQTDNEWQVEKQILETEKIDYKSGELVTYKPSTFGISCN